MRDWRAVGWGVELGARGASIDVARCTTLCVLVAAASGLGCASRARPRASPEPCDVVATQTDPSTLAATRVEVGQTIVIAAGRAWSCPCGARRSLAGDTERRAIDGDTERRGVAGDTEGRAVAGDTEGRGLAGDTEGRGLAGDTEGRGLAGDTEGRALAGDTEDRRLAAATEDRTLAGASEDRGLAGDTEAPPDLRCVVDDACDGYRVIGAMDDVRVFDGTGEAVPGRCVRW